MLTESDFYTIKGLALAGHIDAAGAEKVFEVMDVMMRLLDDGDNEDFYGTGGWKYHLGWGE